MLHLDSQKGLEYIGRLIGTLEHLIVGFENENAPASLQYLKFLFEHQHELLLGYHKQGYTEPGVHIADSGFPSVPSLLADIETINERLVSPIGDLERRIEEAENALGTFSQVMQKMDIEKLTGLKSEDNDIDTLKKEKEILEYEKEFFAQFLKFRNRKWKSYGFFELQEENGLFVLKECLIPIFQKRMGFFKRKWYNVPKKEYEHENVLEAVYFDPSVYNIENPILVAMVSGSFSFVYPYKDEYTEKTRSQINKSMMTTAQPIGDGKKSTAIPDSCKLYLEGTDNLSKESSDSYLKFEKTRALFRDLMKTFHQNREQEGRPSGPQKIFEVFEAAIQYALMRQEALSVPEKDRIRAARENIGKFRSLTSILSQQNPYAELARAYVSSH